MGEWSRWRLYFFAPALVAACGALDSGAAVIPEVPAWTVLNSSALTVFSQADEEQTRKIATALAQFRRALPVVAKDLTIPDNLPIVAFAFRNPEAMRPYEPSGFENAPGLLGGFYFGDKRGGFVGIRAYLPGNPLETVFHEMVHAAQFRNYESLPLWLQEGQAEYYSTLRISGSKAEVGTPPAARVQWFDGHPPVPLRALFGVTESERARFDRDQVVSLYATSWAFVHFLRHASAAPRLAFEKYQADLAAGVPEAKAHLTAFGIDWAALETAFRAYVAANNFVSESVALAAPVASLDGPVSPAPRFQLLAELGRMLLAPSPPSLTAAEEHVRAALALAPEDPLVLAAMGACAYRKGRCKEAAPFFRRAIGSAEAPADRLLEGATALLCLPTEDSISADFVPPKPDQESRAEVLLARDWLRRGLAVFPEDVPALAAVGLTYVLLEDEASAGIAALEAALRLAPRRGDSAWNLMLLYLRTGDRAKAKELVDGPIADRLSRSEVARARAQLLQFELNRAVGFVNEGRFAAAVDLLRQLAADETSPGTKRHIEAELERVQSHMARQAELDAYNAAADLARKGDSKPALRAFQKLLEVCKEPEVCERAKEAVRRLTGAGVRAP